MQSPFPGMDPYLESPNLWSEVHSRLIVAIADDLAEQLSDRYRVAIEKRVYLSTPDDSLLVGIPDVTVRSSGLESPQPIAVQPSQPLQVTLLMQEEIEERFLEIREARSEVVITVLEILSPKNKRNGEGRIAYEQKRQRILGSATHLVEIDLLRADSVFAIAESYQSDYRILVSRSQTRPLAQLYAFGLRDPIPAFPIPLNSDTPEPTVDLQTILAGVYRRGRYHLAIDYTQPPKPPLSPEDEAWMRELFKQT